MHVSKAAGSVQVKQLQFKQPMNQAEVQQRFRLLRPRKERSNVT